MASLYDVASTKYRYQFTSDQGTARSWHIRKEGFKYDNLVAYDLTTELTGAGRGHCNIEWLNGGNDEYGEIMGSRASVSMFDSSGALLADLFANDDDVDNNYALAIMEGATQIWIGKIDTNDLTYNEDGPTQLSFTASDGLGRLADKDYVNTTDGLLDSGRVAILDIIQDCLLQTGWRLDFYTATDMRPKVDVTQLIATDDPLDNIYVDVSTFRIRGGSEDVDSPVTYLEVLRACLTRFGMKIFQAEGAWHLVQVNHLYNSSYRRWKYDYLGALDSTAVFDPTLTVSTTEEDVGRGPGTIGALSPYSAAMSTYDHGIAIIVQNPVMDPPLRRGGGNRDRNVRSDSYGDAVFSGTGTRFRGRSALSSGSGVRGNIYDPGIEYWSTSDAGVKHQHGGNKGSTGYVMYIEDKDSYDWETALDAADWAAINTEIGTRKSTQTTIPEIPSGTSIALYAEAYPYSSTAASADVLEVGRIDSALAIQIKLDTSGTDYYAELDEGRATFSWSTNANTWMLFPIHIVNDWIGLNGIVSDALPAAGNLVISLGPALENDIAQSTVSANIDFIEAVLWDNVDIELQHADGTFNAESSTTINFLDRGSPVIKEVINAMGDGPISITPGRLSNDVLNADDTSDWKEVSLVHDGSAGDTIDEVSTRMMLRSMNRSRKLHSAQYFDISQTVTPLDVLVKNSTNYPAYEITFDVQGDTNSGTWYEAREDGFTDDLVNGLDAGKNRSAFLGRGLGDRAAFLISQLSAAFLTSGVQALTFTTAAIAAGTAHNAKDVGIAVDTMPEPLLKNDDSIILWAPNNKVYQLKMAANQEADDTLLYFDDPDTPGSDFSFPENVASGAGIFLVPEKLATIARLGEQGFAITATNLEIGQVDGAQAATGTSLTVKNWNANYAGLSFSPVVYLDDGTALTLTASPDLPRPGDTTITFSSTTYDAADNEKIWASAQVGRGDFIVTADEASLAINSVQSSNLLVGTTNGAITTGAKTTFQADLLIDVDVGDKFVIVSDNATEWGELYDITAVDDQVIGTNVQIFCASFNPSNTIPTGSSMYMQSKHVTEGKLAVKADEISALITRTSEPLGTFTGDQTVTAAEQVTNGAFTTDVSWTKGTGWTIDTANSNVAEAAAGVGSALSQVEAGVTNTTKFAVSFEISGRTAGSVTLSLGGTPGTARSTDGKYNEIITAGATPPQISLAKDSSFDGNIDNLTVREVFVISALPAKWDLKAGDTAYHWDRSLRVLTEVQIATDADNGTAGVALSATDTVEDGDILYAGLVSGLNIEFGSIDVVNSYIQSSNYVAATTGWHIDEDGSAEFANATVRGTVFAGTAKLGDNVQSTNDGLWLDADNYWYDTGQFSLGGTNGMAYSGAGSITIGSDLDINGDATISGTLSVSGGLEDSAATEWEISDAVGLNFENGTADTSVKRGVTWNGGSGDDSAKIIFYVDAGDDDSHLLIEVRDTEADDRVTLDIQCITEDGTAALLLGNSTVTSNTEATLTADDISISGITCDVEAGTTFTTKGDTHLTDGTGDTISFHGGTGATQQTITGSRAGNAALADLLTKLATLGLIVDSSS